MLLAQRKLSFDKPFAGYSYSYPHKSAYRPLTTPVPLQQVWAEERRSSLFLYFHLPFCEYRCGFCNLFTLANPDGDLVASYLRQLNTEAKAVRSVVPDAQFARIAIGGGTPTFLSEEDMSRFLEGACEATRVNPRGIPTSCEASPATLTRRKAKLLRDWGVDRLSLGVQSFDDSESRAMGRPQSAREALRAIEIAREQAFPTLNLDLIYGVPGQSTESWLRSLNQAIRLCPEEIYLYPLYVRKLTGLARIAATPNDNRVEAYRRAHERLVAAGYVQQSLRMFRSARYKCETGPVYCCQSDGMIGLGCGARSYTRALHYSTEFAVGRTGVFSILGDYVTREPKDFRVASYGIQLNAGEQRRRYTIQSLLQTQGISAEEYRAQFSSELLEDLPQLVELINGSLAMRVEDRIILTCAGLELSDAIGPWLYSRHVRQLMEEFECH